MPPAGVDFEEAGEKWRAGDAAKSTRFFVRAIDEYEKGLRAFPQSFDLAYNKWVVVKCRPTWQKGTFGGLDILCSDIK